MKDKRPWRTYRVQLPEDVALIYEEAMLLAKGFGLGTNPIECLEAICVEFITTHMGDFAAARQKAEAGDDLYRINSLETLVRGGFRCALCRHSQNLEIHHIWPRGARGSGRPNEIHCLDNLVALCRGCHAAVQPRWRAYVDKLKTLRAGLEAEVRVFGFATRGARDGRQEAGDHDQGGGRPIDAGSPPLQPEDGRGVLLQGEHGVPQAAGGGDAQGQDQDGVEGAE